jgi:hypothetical protein
MRSLIVIIFLGLYGLALVRPALPLVDYYVRLEEYKQRCINKAEPALHCNGKCILMQKLKAFRAEPPTPAAPAPVKVNFEDYPLGLPASPAFSHHVFYINCRPLQPSSERFYPGTYIAEIFHPPSTAA